MARKVDDTLDYFGCEPEEEELSSLIELLEEEPLFGEWLRRDPRWTTDRLVDMNGLRETK